MRRVPLLFAFLVALLPGCQGEQDRALSAIQRLDGSFARDEAAPGNPVTSVDLGMRSADDSTLEHVARFPQLKELSLWGTGITDAGLQRLEGLVELEKVDLSDTAVTDAGLQHLKRLPKLKEVGLKNTRVTVAGVRELQQAMPQAKVRR